MVNARDKFRELEAIAERGPNSGRWLAVSMPSTLLFDFRQRIKRGDDIENLLPFFPVAAVTAIEVYFRLAVADLVDAESSHSARAELLSKNMKFDFATVRALMGKKVSLETFLSYSLSYQSVEGILSVMNSLTGKDFKSELSFVRDRWEVEIEKKHNNPIISDIEKFFADLVELFEVRHIVVHELPRKRPFEMKDIERYLETTRQLLDASNWFVSELIAPNAPLQQIPMNEEAQRRATAVDADMNSLVSKILDLVGETRAVEFQKVQDVWKEFRQASAEFKANEYAGGSIMPMIWPIEFEAVTRARFLELQKFIDELERYDR